MDSGLPPRNLGLSALSRDTGISVATIKFYLREGLLPPGEKIGPRQAIYGEEHRRRLRLIRVLVDIRGLSLKETRALIRAIDSCGDNPHLALGLAIGALEMPAEDDTSDADSLRSAISAHSRAHADDPDLAAADELFDAVGWQIHRGSANARTLGAVMTSLRRMHPDIDPVDMLRPYAESMRPIVAAEMDSDADIDSDLRRIERAVVVTMLVDAALTPLRHLAQEDESRIRFGGGEPDYPTNAGGATTGS